MLSSAGEFLVGLVAVVVMLTIGRRHPQFAYNFLKIIIVLLAVNYFILRVRYEGLRKRFFKIAKLEKKRKELLVPPKS